MNNKWAVIGLGFISSRHVQAIEDIGDELIAVCDIDPEKQKKYPHVLFWDDYKSMMKSPYFEEVDYVSICTPNYLHYGMVQEVLKYGKKVLCEKPLVLNAKECESLKSKDIYTVLQLRHNPELIAFKNMFKDKKWSGEMNISLNRGDFYHTGWKGDKEKSGGLLFNIGIHYFDLLLWFFGEPTEIYVKDGDPKSKTGYLKWNKNRINWRIDIKAPMDNQYRILKVNDQYIDLTKHFEDLHTKVYRDIKNGIGITPKEAMKSIKLVENLSSIS